MVTEDNSLITQYYSKVYSYSHKFLPWLKLGATLFIIVSILEDFNTFCVSYLSSIRESPVQFLGIKNSQTPLLLTFRFGLKLHEFAIVVAVIFYANFPVQNKPFQLLKITLSTGTAGIATLYEAAYSSTAPNPVSNLVHTRFYRGRGYDFDRSDISTKIKSHAVASLIGRDLMLEAVKKYGPSLNIISSEHLQQIIKDPKYSKLMGEKATLRLPLITAQSIIKKTISAVKPNNTKTTFGNPINRTNDYRSETRSGLNKKLLRFFYDPVQSTNNQRTKVRRRSSNPPEL